ncbi:hypothetical protein AG1IA_07229 [Rhizoctonia solani AG-1 IA]|uniref:Uncharacterized protein n=1 Tax=Thanatephorus cucumeris (strain AG1-IA) TaxID=983506 RepID=L8WPP4_THACA|nr:hypothetical protein AG1IA_07229 [Rhizoctonia solani AG-1 IA]
MSNLCTFHDLPGTSHCLTYASVAVGDVWVLYAVQEGKPVTARRRPRGRWPGHPRLRPSGSKAWGGREPHMDEYVTNRCVII